MLKLAEVNALVLFGLAHSKLPLAPVMVHLPPRVALFVAAQDALRPPALFAPQDRSGAVANRATRVMVAVALHQ